MKVYLVYIVGKVHLCSPQILQALWDTLYNYGIIIRSSTSQISNWNKFCEKDDINLNCFINYVLSNGNQSLKTGYKWTFRVNLIYVFFKPSLS